MTLSIATRQIQQPAALSRPARLCLSLIDGGIQWLQWAMQSGTHHFRLTDETAMLCAVQQGLHGQALCILPVSELLISPSKLMTLTATDLQTLVNVEAQGSLPSDAVLANQLAQVLTRHRLILRGDVAAVQSWLGQLLQGSSPLFQCLSIEDAAMLTTLMRCTPAITSDAANAPPTAATETQASAAFAAKQARTPAEFCDYLRFHDVLQGRGLQGQAQELLDQILPEAFGCLDCPQLRGLPAPSTVVQVVRDWYTQSRQLGFSRLSLAALRLVQRTSFPSNNTPDARTALWRYTTAAQILLSGSTQVTALMSQDGQCCSYRLSQGTQRAVLSLDAHNIISLDDFVQDTTGLPDEPTAVLS
jgi:hypothetical protein